MAVYEFRDRCNGEMQACLLKAKEWNKNSGGINKYILKHAKSDVQPFCVTSDVVKHSAFDSSGIIVDPDKSISI